MSIHDKRNLECHVGDTAQTPMYPAPNTYSGDMLIYWLTPTRHNLESLRPSEYCNDMIIQTILGLKLDILWRLVRSDHSRISTVAKTVYQGLCSEQKRKRNPISWAQQPRRSKLPWANITECVRMTRPIRVWQWSSDLVSILIMLQGWTASMKYTWLRLACQRATVHIIPAVK